MRRIQRCLVRLRSGCTRPISTCSGVRSAAARKLVSAWSHATWPTACVERSHRVSQSAPGPAWRRRLALAAALTDFARRARCSAAAMRPERSCRALGRWVSPHVALAAPRIRVAASNTRRLDGESTVSHACVTSRISSTASRMTPLRHASLRASMSTGRGAVPVQTSAVLRRWSGPAPCLSSAVSPLSPASSESESSPATSMRTRVHRCGFTAAWAGPRVAGSRLARV